MLRGHLVCLSAIGHFYIALYRTASGSTFRSGIPLGDSDELIGFKSGRLLSSRGDGIADYSLLPNLC